MFTIRPERTLTVRIETPETAKRLLKQSISLSGWGDLNSRPSVPQTDALTKLRHSPLWSGHSTVGVPLRAPPDQVR